MFAARKPVSYALDPGALLACLIEVSFSAQAT